MEMEMQNITETINAMALIKVILESPYKFKQIP